MPATADTTSSAPLRDPALILDHFAELPDPRRQQGQVHVLEEIIFMAVCAVICGADSWEQIADYSRSKIDWLQTFLTLPDGTTARLCETGTRVFDQSQNANLYRRDLLLSAEYATTITTPLPAMIFGNSLISPNGVTTRSRIG